MEWKPTGKVFTSVRHRWLPTGKTFTIIGTQCPLTRIPSNPIVPPKETSQTPVITSNPKVKVYHRRIKVGKSISFNVEPSILGSRPSNILEPNRNWGSVVSNSPSSSHIQCRSSKSSCDNGTEFVNQTLKSYYEDVRISHQTSVACTPQQNNIVERKNRTLVEATRTMLIFSKAPLYLWAEAVVTACYTQNRSLISKRHNKTPYELLHDRKPDLKYLHIFGALCYLTNDSEDLGKLKPKADISIFIGYALSKKAYRIYNKRTWQIVETIHTDFDELTTMASKQSSLGPVLHEMTPGTISS
ncbi:retrovirus-related pol polyprotein from transposon TNT 1-94 [Tanacetum coccineum]